MPHVWFRIDLSGTPPQFREDVRRKDWAAVKRTAAKDARECGALLDELLIQGSGHSHIGRVFLHVADDWPGSDGERRLKERWEIRDEEASEVLFTVEEMDPPTDYA